MTAGAIDSRHLLLVGAGPGLGLAVARRFASGGYRVTLVARSTDRFGELARSLADTGAEINTIEADASRPGGSCGPGWLSSTAGMARLESSSTTRSWARRISS